MDPSLKAATLGAANIQAPPSPLGASNAPELAKLYQSGFQLPQATGATNAAGNIASQELTAASSKKSNPLADINNYKFVQKPDGGYDFYDPAGQQVDIATLANRTGAKPADVLKDSQNPIDIQYRNDYKNLQDYVNAVLSKDTAKIKAYQKAEPALQQYTDKGGVHKLIEQFQQSYERYYVPRSINPNAWGANVPNNPIVPTAQTGTALPGLPSLGGASGIGQTGG